ncbi:MAG TPA: NHL repeat-containing protein, partial [Turneriella sp.]|nr:NHL repeat-containing protein [Turneriella sp.]
SGAAHTQLNTTFATAKVTPRFMTVLYAGSKEGTLVALSAAGAGGTLDDLYILEGTSAGMLWEQQSSKPQSGAATAPVWVQPQLTATRVYGQNGLFTCAVVNNNNSGCTSGGGTPNDKSLYRGSRPAISDDGLYIADQLNNRALFFPGISTTATRVYCQAGSFTTATFGTVPGSQTCRGNPSYGNVSSVFVDSSGVYVNDIEANRVLFFAGANIDAASGLGGRIYGQGGNYTTFAAGTTAQTFTNPDTTTSDIDGIYISNTNNNRVLFYSGTSTTATRIFGQNGNFNTNTGSVSADGLSGPRGVAIAPDGIYIADNGNNRVLFYPGTSTTATRVYGQSNMTSNTAGGGASSLNWPWGVKYFGGGIYVVDYNNHRVLFFPENSGTATHVWGQNGSFTANSANQGGSVSATSLNNPYAVDVDHTGMYVGDNQNHRVVFYPR